MPINPRAVHQLANLARQRLDDARMLARLSRDVFAFFREPITLDQSIAWQRERLATRDQWFLRVAEEQIYGYPKSPYLKLLRAAGCELGDLRALVAQEGVEGTLERLVQRGVYVTFDELKGRREAVRGSQRFAFHERDFDNPLVEAHFALASGGTGGRRSRVIRSLPFLAETAHCFGPALDAHGALNHVQVTWSTGPATHLLRFPKMRVPLGAWFYPLSPLPWTVRLGGLYLVVLGRLAGQRLPLPRHGDLLQPTAVLSWLVEQRRRGQDLCVLCTGSAAVRTATLATEAGISLDGLVFFLRSEALTQAKLDAIEASGARAFTNYGMQEASILAIGCATPQAPDDVHVFDSRFAVVERRRPLEGTDLEIDALLVTSLTEHAGKTLLNVETGDYADLERRDCGCKLGALGLYTHLSHIRSFEKLTGEGMTFVRTNLTHVVETVLPARFGGTSVDYQVVEEERPDGLPRLVLRISPTVGPLDKEIVRVAFLGALAQDGDLERHMAAMWKRANTIEIERQPPLVTAVGKVLPFQLVRPATRGVP